MPLPAPTRTDYIYSVNNVITYVSVVETTRSFLRGIKDFLVTNGYTVIGSSNGVTAALDATDRWTTNADVVRGTGTTTVQSWIILRDGNAGGGADILFAFQGNADNTAKISYSPTRTWSLAGTPTHQPTSPDEVISAPVNSDMINTTASGNRIWSGWTNAAKTCFRFAVFRAGTLTRAFAIEDIESSVQAPATFSPAMAGLSVSAATYAQMSGQTSGVTQVHSYRAVTSGIPRMDSSANGGSEGSGTSPCALQTYAGNTLDYQGGLYGAMRYTLWGANTLGFRGKLGTRIDMWAARGVSIAVGDTYQGLTWIALGDTAWPWDGVTVPVVT